jgi:hypothetical protein
MSTFEKVKTVIILLTGVAFVGFLGIFIYNHVTVHETVTNCTVTDKTRYFSKTWHYKLQTSCADYSTTRSTYDDIAIGETYTFDVSGSIAPTVRISEETR